MRGERVFLILELMRMINLSSARKIRWTGYAVAALAMLTVGMQAEQSQSQNQYQIQSQTQTQNQTQQTTQTQQPQPVTLPDLPDAPGTGAQITVRIEPTGPTAVLDTTMGRITCKLFEKESPLSVANFIGLAEGTKEWTDPVTHRKMHGKRLYDGTIFHRVIPEFMVQGGDPTGTGMGDGGYYFDDELNPDLNFDVPGRLAMANAGPNSNGTQFFITENAQPSLDGHYNLFGQCDDASVDVVKAMARVPRDGNDKPLTPVVLNRVTIVRDGQRMPPDPSAAGQSTQPNSGVQNTDPTSGAQKALYPQR
jgi:peptidyl-prolyl cis-trans isomerase A (cyclophilin A)